MYASGDYVICRSGGVWLVAENDGSSLRLLEHGSGTVKTIPAGSDEIVRPIVSRAAIMEVIDRVAFIRAIQAPGNKSRQQFYDEAMAQYDEIEWVRVIKSVYLRQREKRLLPFEPGYSERAKAYLHGEISVLLQIPLAQVEGYIVSTVANETW
jgi:CarD family transcriptional regulator